MARITKSTATKRSSSSNFPNSNLLLRRGAQRRRLVAAARQPHPSPQLSYRSQSTQTDEPTSSNSGGPQTHQSAREKVDPVLELLHEYRWSFATFIKHYVSASSPSNHYTP